MNIRRRFSEFLQVDLVNIFFVFPVRIIRLHPRNSKVPLYYRTTCLPNFRMISYDKRILEHQSSPNFHDRGENT